MFKKDSICGFLDEDGIYLEFKVDSLIDIRSDRYIGIVESGKMGIYDYDDEHVLIEPQYDFIFESHIHQYGEKLRFVTLNDGLFRIINKKGRVLTKEGFECVTTWVEYGPDGHYICKDDKIGIIDYNGKEVIPAKYDELYYCDSGIFKAVIDQKFGVLGKNGKVLIPFIYESIIVDDFRLNSEEEMFIYANMNGVWIRINYEGEIVESNANECDFIKDLRPYQVNHYGFEYVRGLMISTSDIDEIK